VKGLLLAGGFGTRLRPLTFSGNKHMIPIANEPMLFYGLRHMAAAGITEVGLVVGPLHEGIREAVGDGRSFGLHVTYIHQGEPKGLAHAVLCAREFLADEPFVMYLGDNLLQEGVLPFVKRFEAGSADAVIGVTSVPNPSSYGVVEMDGDRIVSIAEKPAEPKSHLALIGVYLFSPAIHPVIRDLKPSRRGELEITDAIWNLHQLGKSIAVRRVDGWWKDTGKPEDLLEANDLVLRTLPDDRFVLSGTVAEGAQITGRVSLGPGSTIGPNVHVDGPVVIGRDVRLDGNARVGPLTAIGDHCQIHDSSVGRSVVMEGTEIRGPVELFDSIVGRHARVIVGSGTTVRLSCTMGDSTQLRL